MKMIFPKFIKKSIEELSSKWRGKYYQAPFWRSAYDSKEGRYIRIRKLPYLENTKHFSDTWVIDGTKELLYSPIGGTPLFITFTNGM